VNHRIPPLALLALLSFLLPAPARFAQTQSPVGTGAPQTPPTGPKAEVARVRALVAEARWQEALEVARTLAAAHPELPELHVLVGDTFLMNFQAKAAAGEYAQALASPRYAPTALSKLAGAWMALGQEAEALRVIREGIAAGIELTEGTLVLQAKAEGDPSARVAVLKQLVAKRPEDRVLLGQLELAEALLARTKDMPQAPAGDLGSTKVKEIYREPSVRLTINGKEDWLALDTGSESILLNGDTAKRLKLPVLAETEYVGWGYRGPRKSRYVFVDRLDVAGRILRGTPAIVNQRDSQFRTNKAGYLSLGPFRDVVVRYDRREGVFSLHPSGTDPAVVLGGAPTFLPVLWSRDLPLVPVMVQGRGPFPFLLDTGAAYTLLDTKNAEVLGIRVNTAKYGKLRAEGISGSFTSNIAEQVTLGVANTRYDRPLIFVTDVPQHFPIPVFGILGRDILNDYALAFDGPRATLALLRYPN
jgi:tetratricopeptide (TPR) repeat protein